MGARVGEFREVPGSRAREIIETAKMYEAITTQDWNLVISGEGNGVRIFDVDGNEYLDFCSGVGVTNLGHKNPKISQVLKERIDAGVLNYDANVFTHPLKVALAKKLSEIIPGDFLKRTFFCNSGTEAVEGAVKLCFYNRPERKRFISFEGAFHGRTLGALPLMGAGKVRIKNYPLAYTCHHFLFPQREHPSVIEEIERRLKVDIPPEEVNAIFLEIVQGEGGINLIHRSEVEKLVELCKKYEIWLVVDEIQTGFGRTGKMFACEHFGLVPDIVTLAKCMGSGEVIGTTVFRSELDPQTPGWHSNTFGGSPKACAAVLATIEELSKEGFLREVEEKGNYLLEKLKEIKEDFHKKTNPQKFICEVRGMGLMIGVEFGDGKKPLPEFRAMAKKEALKRGLVLIGAGQENINPVLRFMPPLIITKKEIDKALEIFKESLEAAFKEVR